MCISESWYPLHAETQISESKVSIITIWQGKTGNNGEMFLRQGKTGNNGEMFLRQGMPGNNGEMFLRQGKLVIMGRYC